MLTALHARKTSHGRLRVIKYDGDVGPELAKNRSHNSFRLFEHGDEQMLGKPAGNDLREGTWTLPLIYAVSQGGGPLLRDLARSLRPPSAERAPELLAAVIASGGAARAMDEAQATAARAIDQLAGFPPSQTIRALVEVCDFVLSRQS